MLKGHVFSKQIFENPIYALWTDIMFNKQCGIGPYKNEMKVTKSESTLTVASGTACIRGRFVEEDTSTPIVAGTDNAYCILVIEVDLDKTNTESELNQVAYKIVKGSSGYPTLTQTDIAKNNSGIYQFELARFKTGSSGITDFQDTRTFLDFNNIVSVGMLELVFPVGSIYTTQTNTNPNTILGFGTWERFKGKVCVGLDEDDEDGYFDEIGKTGGEKKHKLSRTELPIDLSGQRAPIDGTDWSQQGATTHESNAFNITQPYEVTGYKWIRRA